MTPDGLTLNELLVGGLSVDESIAVVDFSGSKWQVLGELAVFIEVEGCTTSKIPEDTNIAVEDFMACFPGIDDNKGVVRAKGDGILEALVPIVDTFLSTKSDEVT